MLQFFALFKKLIKNKVLFFVLTRYITYFIQFVNSLFIAVYLGPFYLGIWGFINLVIQYFAQINFGISYYVNATISINKNKETYVRNVIGTSLFMLIILSTLFLLFFIVNDLFNLSIGEKYSFSKYAPFVCMIAVLGNFNSLLSNVFRIYGKLFEIAFSQSIFPVLIFIIIFLFKGDDLLWALVITNCISVFLSLLLFFIKSPVKVKLLFIWSLAKTIQQKGWHLFIYNTAFYLIIISTRSFVSGYYNVSEFGYFTFSYSLANTIFLLFESFSYLIFPKMINRFASNTNEQISLLLEAVRDAYITLSHGLIHLAIFLFPVFLLLLPKYESAGMVFKTIALTVVLYTNSFGYQSLLIAKGEEKLLGRLSFLALGINIFVAFILVIFLKVPYSLVIISTMITYLIYVFLLGFFGRKRLSLETKLLYVLKDVYPIRLFIPYVLSICLLIIAASNGYYIIPLVIFLLLNYKAILNAYGFVKKIIVSPNMIEI